MNAPPKRKGVGAVTARAEAQVMRLALVYALMDGSSVISLAHLRAALEVWRYCFASARYVFGSTIGDPVADEILSALRRSEDGLTRTEISARVFGRNRSADQISHALDALQRAGLAYPHTDTSTGGRHAERWYADELNERDEQSDTLDGLNSFDSSNSFPEDDAA
jgi:hypothetical protein